MASASNYGSRWIEALLLIDEATTMQPHRFIVWLGIAAALLSVGRVESRDAGASGSRSGALVERKTFVLGGAAFALDLPNVAVS